MGVYVVLIDAAGRAVRGAADPTGGTFDAAGDFDRLVEALPERPTWSRLARHRITTISNQDAVALAAELPSVLARSSAGAERRGVMRLAALARHCEDDVALTLRCVGD